MAYASVISSSAVIRGNVRGDGSLQILGRIEGDVGVTGDLELGPEAVVVGAISGARIVIGGSVEGDVTGSEAVVISASGKVIGDLAAPSIGMSEGALVRGSVRTDGVAASSSARARVPASRHVEADAAPRPAARPAAAPAASSAASSSAKSAPKRPPPPPVIQAPRAGARARKRMLKR
ncbi:MAG TPA: polymer-forming cytoskeletal protein [Polyangiaceae bacterium]|nr:polymer-forming cytoskeletal protein [Polyangiaceae bacterium]